MAMNSEVKIYLPLEGVESEHCAAIVEKGLAKVEGVNNAQVEVNNRRAVIVANGSAVIEKAKKAVEDLGYGVPMVNASFPVLEMSCAACATSVESTLQHQIGVVEAGVNFANNTATVQYIPGLTSPEVLKAAIQAAGYDLLISETSAETLEDIREGSYQRLKKRVIWALLFAIPLFVVGMFFMEMPYANYIMWALSTPMLFYFGQQFFVGAWKQLKHRSANMDTLVAVSTGTAYIYSVVVTLFTDTFHSKGIHPHVYFEAAGIVIAFILLGKLLEEKAKAGTSSAIKKLMGLQPQTVTLVQENGEQKEVKIQEVNKGDTILVKPGERLAVDGRVVSGGSFVDESMISGEPIPVEKKESSHVFSGTINQKGSFLFKAEKVGSETVLAQIIQMVGQAQGSKAPVQKTVDKVAAVFVPVVIGIAILAFVAWLIFGHSFSQAMVAFVTVLVIACPCALGLATPTAIMVGMGKGAENGILIKDAVNLETARKVSAVVVDKTGTITVGKPAVSEVLWIGQDSTNDILYSIEKSSSHPLAAAVVDYLGSNTALVENIKIENLEGQGIKGELDGSTYWVGNRTLLDTNGVGFSAEAESWIKSQLEKAQTLVFFAQDKTLLACIAISDQIKASSAEAVASLHKIGVEVYMLTGDNAYSAKAVADQVGIKNYKAGVLPAGKAAFVKELQNQGKVVAMVGDGINDSNALAQADVGIAMGKGSDIAMDVAGITLMSSDLTKIKDAILLSKYTSRAINQNLFWAFIYNVIGIPVAAGVLYPINGFLLDPMWAGAAMAFSSVSVVLNSLRLKWR